MKNFIAPLLAVLLLFAALGCSAKPGIAGTWYTESDGTRILYNFKSDGTGSMSSDGKSVDFTYAVNGGKITVTVGGHTDSGSFSLEGNRLTLTDEYGTTVLTRK